MTQTRPSRGRPKGSGLDDHEHLRAIAHMIARDPALKPTTAIKATGITDPSSIRRLRDKYHAMKSELSKDIKTATPAPAQRRAAAVSAAQPKKRTSVGVAAKPRRSASAKETIAKAPGPAGVTAASAALPSTPSPQAWLAMWYGMGLQGLNSAVAVQISFVENVMRMPHVATALRNQIAMNEFAVTWCPSAGPQAKTIH